MKKLFYSGISLVSVIGLIAILAGTYTGVAVVSCDYCKVKEIASVQSDALDNVAVNETKKASLVMADNKIFTEKLKADAVVAHSFSDDYKKVDTYVSKSTSAEGISIADNIELDHQLYARYDKTRTDYQLAAGALFDDGITSLDCGQASGHQQGFASEIRSTVTGATAESEEQLCGSGQGDSGATVDT